MKMAYRLFSLLFLMAAACVPAYAADGSVELNLKALDKLKKEAAPAPAPAEKTAVPFAPGNPEPTETGRQAAEKLAQQLKDDKARLTIVAYAETGEGETENDARRLALRRAINLRQILIAGGIEGTRVNLQPQGPRSDSGEAAEIVVGQP
jgi:outer membrane protein OmpA-like peptidoglycan-associated protein